MWEEKRLGEICDKVISGGTPNTKVENYYINGDISWLKTKEVLNNNIYFTETKITKQGLDNSSAKLLPINSIIIAMYGDGKTAGRVAINKVPLATNQACCNLIINNQIADYKYIFYNLINRYDEFVQLKSGGSQQNLNTKTISNLKIKLPTLPTQQKIAEVLSAYDDIIENNNRRIELLEQAAQSVYKEWFVRFRFPGYEATHFTKGIPDGWEVRKIAQVCKTIGGGTPSTSVLEYWDNGEICWATPSDITALKSLALLDTSKKITRTGLERSSAKLLPKNAILMTSRATIGYFAMADFEVCTNQGFISIIPDNKEYHYYILYNLINRKEELELKAAGATFKELSKSTFRKFDIIFPDLKTLKVFNKIAAELIEEVRLISKQNQNLVKQRDLLLPRLMSGKLEV
jgi:type I restriction enzyme S subunit